MTYAEIQSLIATTLADDKLILPSAHRGLENAMLTFMNDHITNTSNPHGVTGEQIQAWSLNGNSTSVVSPKFGTLNGRDIELVANGSRTGYVFNSTGNWGLGNVTVDAGYKLDVKGTTRIQGDLSVMTNSATATFSVSPDGNSAPVKFTNNAMPLGFIGGFIFYSGYNAVVNTPYRIMRLYSGGITSDRGNVVAIGDFTENAIQNSSVNARLALLSQSTINANALAYEGVLNITLQHPFHSFTNNKRAGIIIGQGSATSLTNGAGTGVGINAGAVFIGYQYHPTGTNNSCDMVLATGNSAGSLQDVLRLRGQDSVGIFLGAVQTAQPSVTGAGLYKWGKVVTVGGGLILSTTNYVEVDIDGNIVKLATV